MPRSSKPLRQSRVPAGRIERLARFGWMSGELALGALTEGMRRMVGATVHGGLVFSEANAERLAKRLASLRGAAMKIGQMLSLQGEDILPAELTRALAILRADANTMPPAQLHRALKRAYGSGWEALFRRFDETPVAAASIGQVHRALTADGRDVALKVQYPGIARSIDADVENVAAVLRLARLLPGDFDPAALLAEVKRQLRRETDYKIEAGLQNRYAVLVAGDPQLLVPAVHDELTTTRILAMDFLDGTPLEELCEDGAAQTLRDHLGLLLYRLMLRELFEFHFLQSDPNFANYVYLPATEQLGLLDFGGSRDVPIELSAQYRRLLGAAAANDRTTVRQALCDIGFARTQGDSERADALAELFLIGCEPFRHRGAYDFGASDIPARARELGLQLAAKGLLRPPPPATVFLHRKLAGMFLLCARMRARVDVRTLLRVADAA
ncbi:MAG: AarF/ABC1/UbiB kinase family protein [Deltaproteobacteria bacterium]|nr:AarF/ABC1/UbiB kinase family protein [Deltaproteobacteria bacterium]